MEKCIFCKNDNLETVNYIRNGLSNLVEYQVYCYQCGASGPFEDTEEEAIDSWNKAIKKYWDKHKFIDSLKNFVHAVIDVFYGFMSHSKNRYKE